MPTVPKLSREIIRIRNEIEMLHIPPAAYCGIGVGDGRLHIAELVGHRTTVHAFPLPARLSSDRLASEISAGLTGGTKTVAAGYTGPDTDLLRQTASELWLTADIIPISVRNRSSVSEQTVVNMAKKTAAEFDDRQILRQHLSPDNEVLVRDLVTLDAYRAYATAEEILMLRTLASKFRGHSLLFISSTPSGGGVALMRHALIRLFRLVGVSAHWHVLSPEENIFEITKRKFFNVLQGVSDPRITLTTADKTAYRNWIKKNASILENAIAGADVIVADDLQTSGLVPRIRRINPGARVIYRSHLQIESALTATPHSQQHAVWSFVWNSIGGADRFASHPVPAFVPPDVPKEKTVYMPASTDPVDGLNKPLAARETAYYVKLFNKHLLEQDQAPLDTDRPYFVQIARFDPSKGIPDAIEAFRKLRQHLKSGPLPQLVIAGNGAVDDPEGVPILNITRNLIRSARYGDIGRDIKVARLPAYDQMLNALLRLSTVSLQLSIREGFEIKITEALGKGIPVVAYDTGGIPLQLRHGEGGYLVKPGDTTRVAGYLSDLITDPVLYKRMSAAAAAAADSSYYTIPNATRWLTLALSLLEK